MDIGGGIIFDDDTNLSWLKNANTAATNTFGVGGINANGTMNWSTANDWTAAMNTVNYLGFTDWRLPTTLDPDSSCTDDSAGAIPSTDTRGFNCTGSELGHLFNVEGVTAAAPGLFSNVQNAGYWSGTELAANATAAWNFRFDDGRQFTPGKGFSGVFAWAVRSGDPIPEPSTILLLGTGLAGLMVWRMRKGRA